MQISRPTSRKRSHFGCKTCRIRKVKCDETRPECINCIKAGWTCEGPGARISVSQPKHYSKAGGNLLDFVSASRLASRSRPLAEVRQFEYYTSVVALSLGCGFDLDLWGVYLPRLAQTNNSIWYFLLAMSGLSEHPDQTNRLPCNVSNDRHSFGGIERANSLTWYENALQQARSFGPNCEASITSTEIDLNVVKCLLCLAIELQLGNAKNVLNLANTAFSLIVQIQNNRWTSRILSLVVPVLIRFSAALSLYGFRLPDTVRQIAASCSKRLDNDTGKIYLLIQRDRVSDILYEAQCLIQIESESIDTSREGRRLTVKQSLENWWQELDAKCLEQETKPAEAMLMRLKILYRSIKVQLHCYMDETSLSYDAYQDEFMNILNETKALISEKSLPSSFSFEMGHVVCLLFATWQCRHPEIRRQFLQILSASQVQESFWTSKGTLELLSNVVEFEGPSLDKPPFVTRRVRAGLRIDPPVGTGQEMPSNDKYSIILPH